MRPRAWPRAVPAAALTTAAFLAWRWGFSPVFGEGTYVPWTVLGIILAAATVFTDRITRPFTGVVTTTAGAGLAYLLSGGRRGLEADTVFDLLYMAPATGLIAAAVSGLHLLFCRLPRARRPWAAAVVVLGGSAWVAWMGWWAVDGSSPAHPGALTIGAACTLLVAAVLGEITIGPWLGALFALAPVALLSVAPLSTSDALWVIAWIIVVIVAAAGCLAAVGGVALIRGVHRRLSFASR